MSPNAEAAAQKALAKAETFVDVSAVTSDFESFFRLSSAGSVLSLVARIWRLLKIFVNFRMLKTL